MDPTDFLHKFPESNALDQRPFTSYRELLPLLRSHEERDWATLVVRLAHTEPERGRAFLHEVLHATPHRHWIGGLFSFWMVLRTIEVFLQDYLLPGASYFHDLAGVTACVLIALVARHYYEHRGTRSAALFLSRLYNDARALPILLKFLYKRPVTARQRQHNEDSYREITRLLEELSYSHLRSVPQKVLRDFFEFRQFRRLRHWRRRISETHLYLLVAILHFLMRDPVQADRWLVKQVADTPIPDGNFANRSALVLLRDVAQSLLQAENNGPRLTPLTAQPSPTVALQSRRG